MTRGIRAPGHLGRAEPLVNPIRTGSGFVVLTAVRARKGRLSSVNKGVQIMTSEQNEAAAHRWHLEVVQEGNTGLADQILTSNVLIHVNG